MSKVLPRSGQSIASAGAPRRRLLRILAVIETPSWIERHIVQSLRDMGHQVTVFSYGPFVGEFYDRSRRAERYRKNNQLTEVATDLARATSLDLIFCYVYDDFLSVDAAAYLSKLGIPITNLNVDMANQWYRQTKTAKYFSYVLCSQRINMQAMERIGARALYFPMAARQTVKRDRDPGALAPQGVTFVGTAMPYRTRVLAHLDEAKVPLAVYGSGWDGSTSRVTPEPNLEKTLADLYHYGWQRVRAEGIGTLTDILLRKTRNALGLSQNRQFVLNAAIHKGYLPEEALLPLFRQSKINLGFTRMVNQNPLRPGVNQIKLRDVEVPMAGGFYLVEKAPEHHELFDIGSEIETWETIEELKDKIRFFLSNDRARNEIASAGLQRAEADHTWDRRFEMLFGKLGIA